MIAEFLSPSLGKSYRCRTTLFKISMINENSKVAAFFFFFFLGGAGRKGEVDVHYICGVLLISWGGIW